jgi:hypothetical protein
MPTIKIEGQTIKGDTVGITDEIARDDDLLKAALAPTWPDARTAGFKREGGKDGKELVVTVQKKAGTKGMPDPESGLIQRLFSAPEGINPAVEMSEKLASMEREGQLSMERLRAMLPEIEAAANLGERDMEATRTAIRSLEDAVPITGREIPLGF